MCYVWFKNILNCLNTCLLFKILYYRPLWHCKKKKKKSMTVFHVIKGIEYSDSIMLGVNCSQGPRILTDGRITMTLSQISTSKNETSETFTFMFMKLKGTLSRGSACSRNQPAMAWPASWYATVFFSSGCNTCVFFSRPAVLNEMFNKMKGNGLPACGNFY